MDEKLKVVAIIPEEKQSLSGCKRRFDEATICL